MRTEQKVDVNKYREVVKESIVEGPPGIHGCIIEIDFKKVKNTE